MAYERFDKRSVRLGEPSFTIRTDGRIRLNADATRLLAAKAVTHVWIFWDASRSKLALKPTNSRDKAAYKVVFSKTQNMSEIGAKAFIRHLGWNSPRPFSTSVTWNTKEALLEGVEPLPKEFFVPKRMKTKPDT